MNADDRSCSEDLEKLLGKYIDRFNAGEALDLNEIRTAHPQVADELIGHLVDYSGIDPSNEELPISRTFGDYRILRELGRGATGVVYLAIDHSLDRQVALKVLNAGAMADNQLLARFQREARIIAKLRHPSIVAIFGRGVEGGSPFICEEYVEGPTLDQALHGEPRTEVAGAATEVRLPRDVSGADLSYCLKMAALFAEIADGLQHAHEAGVIHRDLKPSNLIFDRDGRLRILDFGHAFLEGQDRLTASGQILGTPMYMSPEQIRERTRRIGPPSDIYSLGATLYEVLGFQPPFQGRNLNATLQQILSDSPPPLRRRNPRVTKDLQTVVHHCLHKDPARRYESAHEFAEDLRRVVRGDPIRARAEPLWRKVGRRVRRHRLMAASLLTLLLLFALWQSRPVQELLTCRELVALASTLHDPYVLTAAAAAVLASGDKAGALDLLERLPDDERCEALLVLGRASAWTERSGGATDLLRRALVSSRQLSMYQRTLFLPRLIQLARELGEEPLCREALETLDGLEGEVDPDSRVDLLFDVSWHANESGFTELERSSLERALAVIDQAAEPDDRDLGRVARGYVRLALSAGESWPIKRARALVDRIQDPGELAPLWIDLARVSLEETQSNDAPSEAASFLDLALRSALAIENNDLTPHTYRLEVAGLLLDAGDRQRATDIFVEIRDQIEARSPSDSRVQVLCRMLPEAERFGASLRTSILELIARKIALVDHYRAFAINKATRAVERHCTSEEALVFLNSILPAAEEIEIEGISGNQKFFESRSAALESIGSAFATFAIRTGDVALLDEARQIALRVEEPELRGYALNSVIQACANLGDWREARRLANENTTDSGRTLGLASVVGAWHGHRLIQLLDLWEPYELPTRG